MLEGKHLLHDFTDAIILTGPTASGKSACALVLADQIGAEILAMDSMTIYRGMDIGTAKPTADDQARVRHHLIDQLDPWESANVAWWLESAAKACAEIRSRGKRPLFVGGTPFYLKALWHGLFESPPSNPRLRQELENEATQLGNAALHAKLAAVDPITAGRLHTNDVRRIVRALEVYELTGQPISALQQSWAHPPAAIPCFMLDWPRDILYKRIDRRVQAMIEQGWLDEVRSLMQQPMSKEARQAVGYCELMAHLRDGAPSLADTTTLIQQRTRQFAKRQLTWFRSMSGIQSVPGTDSAEDAVRQIRNTLIQ